MCKKFVPDFENKTVSEKNESATQLHMKWKSIRDCCTRELNKRKASKSGPLAETHKQYLYFLSPVTATKPPELEEADTHTDEANNSDVQDGVASNSRKRQKVTDEEKLFPVLAANIKGKKNASMAKADDPDKHFLLSLLDDLKSVPQHLQMDAKFEIISVLRKHSWSYSSLDNYNIQFISQIPMPVYSNSPITVPASNPSPCTSNRDSTLLPVSSDSQVVTDLFSG
ncbi:uncharacterized protein LOC124556139 [Schistocerca americana]|uniref:uncharacterized protein LOC124556139 n=1 Tax=Schistocerca americana TaxID=7009 RepID=UPI001F5037FB|nr:uncharacterized protein LOC124556139 [Schistocerca americana]